MRLELTWAIRSMALPEGWTEVTVETPELASKLVRTFVGPAGSDMQLQLAKRVSRLNETVSRSLNQCLTHVHELDETEWSNLVPMLGNLGDPSVFQRLNARVLALNGRSVLWVDGEYVGQNYSARGFFCASGRDEVEELWCLGPVKERFDPVFDQAIHSIEWDRTC